MRTWVGRVAIAAACVVGSPVFGQGGPRSLGTPQRGTLRDGAPLPVRGPGHRFLSNRGNPDAHYGTPELVALLQEAIATVESRHPGSSVLVGDMSFASGGPIRGHGSHRSGRDVDVAYYALDAEGSPVSGRYVAFHGARAERGPERLDVARTWTFLASLLRSRHARVQYVFVHRSIERVLLRRARALGATPELVRRAARVMRPPGSRGASPHKDHMHVRIVCSPRDVPHGCRDR